MKSFVDRIKDTLSKYREKGYPVGKVLVDSRDLRELLYHFERMDKQERELYEALAKVGRKR